MTSVKNTLEPEILIGSLVLYKKHPARVRKASDRKSGDKLEIELAGGEAIKVRPKDVALLHPGPLRDLRELRLQDGEVEIAWQILSSGAPESGQATISLSELAELIYGEYTPASAWGTWQWVEDGLYFSGAPEAILVRTPEEVAHERTARQARAAQAQARADFLDRLRDGQYDPADRPHLSEVEDMAFGRREESRLLRELGRAESPAVAHALLLELSVWNETIDPYPIRQGLSVTSPALDLPGLPDEPRLDLTHLPAYAIDDRENQDPDDALSLEEGRFWVHVSDVAALVPPESPADLEARGRGANLYLPEGTVTMLPHAAVRLLGLGLNEISPALSFRLELDSRGEITGLEIMPSWVRVQRLSYEDAEQRLEEQPFRSMLAMAQVYQARRQRNGALTIDLPEAIVKVVEGQVVIRPALRLGSRDMVREAMLMAGEAAAQFAIQNRLPFPFVSQEPTGRVPPAEGGSAGFEEGGLAWAFAQRRAMKSSQVGVHPAPHAGLGLPAYARLTSPLRRYADLVAHQQLRAFLRQQPVMEERQMSEQIGESEAVIGSVNLAEGRARRHWTMVYLRQHPGWSGEAVLVEKRGLRGKLIIPELALETQVHLRKDLPLDSRLTLHLKSIDLPALDAHFEIEDGQEHRDGQEYRAR